QYHSTAESVSGYETLYLSRTFYQQLKALAAKYRASVFQVLLGALCTYFSRITQQDDLVIGLPVLNRSQAQFKHTAGLFVGMMPMRLHFDQRLTFAALLQQLNTTLKANYRHQRFPLSEIKRMIAQKRTQLFDISLSYERHDHDLFFNTTTGQTNPLLHGYEQTPFKIFVREFHIKQNVRFDFVYNYAYFNSDDIQALQARFVTLLEAILEQSHIPVYQLPVMTPQERQHLIAWNQTQTDYPQDNTLVALFETQVEQTPERIAVIFATQHLTYHILNQRANQVAYRLMTLGVQANTLVGIYLERSLEMIVGLLGILKAGGAYVPLDPEYPQQRLHFMLEDSQVAVVVTQSQLLPQLPATSAQVLCLDETVHQQPKINPQRRRDPSALAYVIYTSGSSGKPKGALNAHQAICNRLLWMQSYFALTSEDKVLHKTPFSFDVSVWEFFWPLITGAQLVIAQPRGHQDPNYLCQLIKQTGITTLHFVPSMLGTFLDAATLVTLHTLKRIICSGEPLSYDLQHTCFNRLPHVALYNLYGPTEAAIDVTHWHCKPNSADTIVPIGRPVANTQIHILDRFLQPTPINVPGELCIAGIQVGYGYLNRPALTAEKFIEIELFGQKQRIYKTGDRARWRLDGTL
ncbi:MAG: amino acid adenylation domain-containing protein, partial [Pseudomonadota bacterium]|nr:amino acid adenylation domain-containing protein [Pseudomonadota bacterium]